jgi:hypothetical protein
VLLWVLLAVAVGLAGLGVLALLTLRLWRQVRALGRQIAAAGERLAAAGNAVQSAAPPRRGA